MSSIINDIIQFITTYFIDPIRYDDITYNPINTVVYAIILGISIFVVIIPLLNKLKIEINEKFVLSLIFFVLAGSSLRVIEDANIIESPMRYLLITPIIYFVVFFVTVVCLVLSKLAYDSKKIKSYYTVFSLCGFIWFIFNISILFYFKDAVYIFSAIAILIIGVLFTIVAYKLSNHLKSELLTTKLNLLVFFAHMFDASSTFIGIDLHGYREMHVIPLYLIELTGTGFIMFPLKLVVIIPILYLLNTQFEEKDKNLKILMQMTLIVLGLAPAIRNTLRILMSI